MSTKQYILTKRKEIMDFIRSDERSQEFVSELDEQSKDIKDVFNKIQNLDTDFEDKQERTEMLMLLNQTMEDLNKLNKETTQNYEDYIGNSFKQFKERYPGLFKMFIKSEEIDNTALNHCLDTFTLLEDGLIDVEQGKEMGWNKFHRKI